MKRKIILFILIAIPTIFSIMCLFRNNHYEWYNSISDIKCEECLVTQEKTAVGIAEIILFENYGEDNIKSQRPYIVTKENDSIWYIKGRFMKIGFGGVFHIRISSKNGKVIEMIHEK
jgi:hypothetical protein